MRAVCENCATPQPVDWKSGDLCVHCSGPVRHEVRCFWCNAWGPAAGYCRECGAEQVTEASYGAARMLTQAGSDMFAIPKLIKEMDPGRLAVFSGKYAKQRALISRHVDDLLFVEKFCVGKGFAAEAEEAWVTSLPWPDAYAAEIPPLAAPNDPLERVKLIEEKAASDVARRLATVARLYLEDWQAFRPVMQMTRGDDAVAAEAVLAVTWWRTVTAFHDTWVQHFPRKELSALPFPEHVAVRQAYLEMPFDAAAVAQARTFGSVDLKFAAVLADGTASELQEALLDRDDYVSFAAGRMLARKGYLAQLDPWIRKAGDVEQRDIVRIIASDKKREAGVLRDALLFVMEHTKKEDTVSACGRVLARRPTVDVALRVAELSRGETYVVQALMDPDSGLTRDELGRVARALAKHGWLSNHKYGVDDAAKRGALPDDIIVEAFATADEEQRLQLCRVAEEQFKHTKNETTHVALMRIVFGPYDAKVRAGAWWALSRSYAAMPELGYRSFGPMALEPSAIARFFPSVSEFLRQLIVVLGDYATLKEVGYYDFIERLFSGMDAARARALDIDPALTRELVTAMRSAAAWDVWSPLQATLGKAADLLSSKAA